MKKLSKDKRDKLILVGILTLASLLAFYYLVIGTQQGVLTELGERIDAQRDRVKRAEQSVKLAAEIQAEVEELTQQIQAKEATMASGDRLLWFLNKMSGFGLHHNVDIPQISPETVVDVGMFADFPYKASLFKVAGSARYEDLGKFLADFENTMPYARVQNLAVAPTTASTAGTGSAEDSAKLSFSMDVLVLVKPTGR